MTEKTNYSYVGLLVVLSVLFGAVFTYGIFPREVTVEKEKLVEVIKEVEVVKVVNQTVTEEVEVTRDYANEALQTVLNRIGDEDDFLTCENETYEEDEVRVSKLYEDYELNVIDETDNEYEVTFKARFVFDEGKSGISSCKETREYSVKYEDGEKPEIDLN